MIDRIFDHDDIKFEVTARPGLQKLTQSSPTSCMPVSFTMVLSKHAPVGGAYLLNAIMTQLGRDDDRGFHVQELLGIAIELGVAFVPFEASPDIERKKCLECGGTCHKPLSLDECARCSGTGDEPIPPLVLKPLSILMGEHDGVLFGRKKGSTKDHAVAWCQVTQKCLDPDAGVYGLDEFEVDTFWAAIVGKE